MKKKTLEEKLKRRVEIKQQLKTLNEELKELTTEIKDELDDLGNDDLVEKKWNLPYYGPIYPIPIIGRECPIPQISRYDIRCEHFIC